MAVHATSTNRHVIVMVDFNQEPRSANETKAEIKEKIDDLTDHKAYIADLTSKTTTNILVIQDPDAIARLGRIFKAQIEASNPERPPPVSPEPSPPLNPIFCPPIKPAIATGAGLAVGGAETTTSPMPVYENINIQQAISETRTFAELSSIVDRAEIKISFWGNRYICVAGYEGTLDIDGFASKTMDLLKQKNYEFSETERQSGRHLARKIDSLYDESSRQPTDASCFTIMFSFWIEVTTFVYNRIKGVPLVIDEWRGTGQYANGSIGKHANEDFNCYTRAQLQSVFGISPDEAQRRGYHHFEINGIHRWKGLRS